MKAMLPRIDLTPIRSLRSEKPVTKAGQVRRAWADIRAALASGHTLKTVAERLRESGIDISDRQLSAYISVIRREERGGKRPPANQSTTAGTDRKNSQEPLPDFDPLENVKEREQNRPGFQFDPDPDPRKLI
jgi:hypothetical protein